MPEDMILEAMKAERKSHGSQLDMADAFLTLKLGPTAQCLSTFATPIGKVQ